MKSSKSLRSPGNSSMRGHQNANNNEFNRYPAAVTLNFVPGGVIYPNVGPSRTSNQHDQRKYFLNPTEESSSPMIPLILKAFEADSQLNKSAQISSSGQNTTFRAPSLSVLAEATFGPLTGVTPAKTRQWADSMILQYYTQNSKKSKRHHDTPSLLSHLKELEQQKAILNGGQNGDAMGYNRPCGYVFRRGDIAWNCRTCQADGTCVLCDACFRNSDHTGHDVTFHRTSPGGCCDCGDIEAWKAEGCCPAHRPPEEKPLGGLEDYGICIPTTDDNKGTSTVYDEYEAVKVSLRGRENGEAMLKQEITNYGKEEILNPQVKAALGVVIGAAAQCIVNAVDGAGIGADICQWRARWAEQVVRIQEGNIHEEDICREEENDSHNSDFTLIQKVLKSDKSFPQGFQLILRLHNDDVHTFDEVIDALHDPHPLSDTDDDGETGADIDDMMIGDNSNNTISRSLDAASIPGVSLPTNTSRSRQPRRLVDNKEEAEDMTHKVDSDGQVVVDEFRSFQDAINGFKRLKSRSLQCAVISSPQSDLEKRAKVLLGWLKDISSAHPAIGALVVHALLDVTNGQDSFGGVNVWLEPRMIPCWCGSLTDDDSLKNNLRMNAFPPHLSSSYLSRSEARELFRLMTKDNNAATLFQATGSSADFYMRSKFLGLPSNKLKKSPHALWGTIEISPPTNLQKHPILTGYNSLDNTFNLSSNYIFIDTDLRKQQESEKLTLSLKPHDLSGLHIISGIGLQNRDPPDLSVLLDASSFRAPYSPLLLLLLLDPYPTKQVRGAIHQLFLSLLVDSRFKSRFSAALGGVAYRPLSTLFCAGCGTEADTPLGFTVQVFTTGSLVRALGNIDATKKLLEYDGPNRSLDFQAGVQTSTFTIPLSFTVARAIHSNLLGATKEIQMIVNNTSSQTKFFSALTFQDGEHPLTTLLPAAPDDGFLDARTTKHKRLPLLLRDLQYIFETPGTALHLLLPEIYSLPTPPPTQHPIKGSVIDFARIWARLLRLEQGMDPQKRRISGGHVEYEHVRWYEAFGLSLNFAGMRDALAESPSIVPPQNIKELQLMNVAIGNLLSALVREVKLWLYRENVLESGFPEIPPLNNHTAKHNEVLQRSTLHASVPHVAQMSSNTQTMSISCASGVKISEAQLNLIESALENEENERTPNTFPCAIMGDWLRVPHSPLLGDMLSFHLPLHRALATTLKSLFSIIVPTEVRQQKPQSWWKIPVLDDEDISNNASATTHRIEHFSPNHPLTRVLRPTISTSNCRVSWVDGPDCTPTEAATRRSRSRSVASTIAAAKVIHSLCDHPLRCLVAAQQIERHLWARNGGATSGMALNYLSSPLCTSFRDLDLTLVQFSVSGFSVGLGARRAFGLLLSRFNMDGYLCDPVRRPASANTTTSNGGWVNPPRLLDSDHAVSMAEAFFSTICLLVTELPPPPPLSKDDHSAARSSMRRELLHALAAEPRSYSEALSAASFGKSFQDKSNVIREIFSEVLKEIASEKRSQAQVSRAAPPTFELKSECSDEYDPTFFHLRRIEHQVAMDRVARLRKQKGGPDKKLCLPLVTAPPAPHKRFLSSRLILHLSMMDAAIRRSLLFALTGGEWLPPAKPDPPESEFGMSELNDSATGSSNLPKQSIKFGRRGFRSSNVPPFKKNSSKPPFSPSVIASSSVSFLEVLQVLTLQAHTLSECSSLHEVQDLDEESYKLSFELSVDTYLSRLIFNPESLEDCWVLGAQEPIPSSGSGTNKGSILGLLIALYEHRNDNLSSNDENKDDGGGARALVADGHKWLIRFVSSLVNGAQSIEHAKEVAIQGTPLDEAKSSATNSAMYISPEVRDKIKGMLSNLSGLWPVAKDPSIIDSSSKSKAARKAAQMRIMEKMRKQQASFALSISDASGENKVDEDEDEEDLCIICKCGGTDGENNGPLGYLGHVQRSKVLQLRSVMELGNSDDVYSMARVVGRDGCQLRAREELNSAPITCLPRGSLVTILQSKVSPKHDLLSRRVYLRYEANKSNSKGSPVEGWASMQSSQGYVILSPLRDLCYNSTKWGGTRPMIRLCGHAAHLGCVEKHCLSLHQRAAADQPFDGRFAANVDEGEFLCPLCRQLSNVLVPREGTFCPVATTVPDTKEASSKIIGESEKMKELLIAGSKRTVNHMSDDSLPKKIKDEHDATRRFGDNLYAAMQTKWARMPVGCDSQFEKWDFEENIIDDDDEEDNKPSSEDSKDEEELKETKPTKKKKKSVGSVLRFLRQQLIAWSALGHCASSTEASARGVKGKPGTGGNEQQNDRPDVDVMDPWSDYDDLSRDSHPMLLELRRTLTAITGLLNLLNQELSTTLSENSDESKHNVTIIGELLGNILQGNAPSTLRSSEWYTLNSYIASFPCHVARDGMLHPRHEARATAASMWAIKGGGTGAEEDPNSVLPPTPVSVKQQQHVDLNKGWGSSNPHHGSTTIFRPAVASSFLYVPLLSWDLNTLAGAVYSSLLLNQKLTYEDLVLATRILLVGRLVQIIITLKEMPVDNDSVKSSVTHSEKRQEDIMKLRNFCFKSLQERKGVKDYSSNMLCHTVTNAILPFSRSLVLLLRACCSTLRSRKVETSSKKEEKLTNFIEDPEAMYELDGFYVLEALNDGCGLEDWMLQLVDRWLKSLVSFESFHGSVTTTTAASKESQQLHHDDGMTKTKDGNNPMGQQSISSNNGPAVERHSSDTEPVAYNNNDDSESMNLDEEYSFESEDADMEESDGDGDNGFNDLSMDNDDFLEIDDDEEMEEVDDVLLEEDGTTVDLQGIRGTSVSPDDEDCSTHEDHTEKDEKFALVGKCCIIPYQPSLLQQNRDIGPGPTGVYFDFARASKVMRDLSHLGMSHVPNSLSSGLVRLPTSFVELYSFVNKVKLRDLDDHNNDDSSSSETAICLLTGAIMRSGSSRRAFTRSHRPPGPCTLHARKVGSGVGIFFLIQKCTVLLMHNNKSAYSASLYVDEHGEEDPGLGRGRPLFLKESRYEALEALWRQHGIPREVSQIRSTSDRVIRDNWY